MLWESAPALDYRGQETPPTCEAKLLQPGKHELITIKNGGHGFDGAGMKEPVVADAFERVMAFLKRHLR